MAKEFKIEEEVKAAWERLVKDGNDTSWVLFGYPDKEMSTIDFKSEGSGGMPEFKSQLETEGDSILWGGFKVLAVDDRGNTISRRAKFIFVKYLPSAAKSITKARAGPHKGPLKMFINAHLDVEIESVDQLTEEDLKTKLLAVGGAHAPNSYEFHDYSG